MAGDFLACDMHAYIWIVDVLGLVICTFDLASDKYGVNVKCSTNNVFIYEHMLDCGCVGGCFLVDGCI